MQRYELLTRLARHLGARSYLEIGVQQGVTFHQIPVTRKVGVDPDPGSAATVKLTSDAFFAQNQEAFDLIFIDGLHQAEQVIKDIHNALDILRAGGVLVVHDCDPPTERSGQPEPCSGVWCGDVWKAWGFLQLQLMDHLFLCVDTDLGCGLIFPHATMTGMLEAGVKLPLRAVSEAEVPFLLIEEQIQGMTWTDFRSMRQEYLRLIPVDQALDLIASLPPVSHAW